MELMVEEEVTPQLQDEASKIDSESHSATKRLKSRRPVQNYLEMGLSVGTQLDFYDGETTCRVLNGRKVEYQGEAYSLTALSQMLLGTQVPLQPSPRWSYQGKSLNEIYDETYELPNGKLASMRLTHE